ncbi:MAG: alkane 1-monooxygenase [Pseudomonadota bacterium]
MIRFICATLVLVAGLCLGAVLGGIWVWGALIYVTVFAYGVDRLTPVLLANAPADAEFPAADPLSVALALAHLVVLGLAVRSLALSDAPLPEKMALFLAVSLFAGQVGHPNAHELIHRSGRRLRQLGKLVYISILMGHHASSHPLVHHVHVGTADDPVSAPLGRGFWRFFGRAWLGSFKAGARAESKRRNAHAQGLHPYVIYIGGAAAVLGLAFAIAGPGGVLIWIAISGYAQLQIFLSDYVQHYGLRRRMQENGKPEPVGPEHSWNTPHRFSGALMLNAPRHSDHHTHPARVYPALQLDPETMPTLPYSLPMMAVIALFPPLWRSIMDRRVAMWAPGDTG